MKNYYISCTKGISGICKYSVDFYELVLKPRGYILIESSHNLSYIMTEISSRDHVHIEIGIFQKKEIEILFTMLRSNYKHVSITLHDAPLLKYPFFEFRNSFLNKISMFYDKHINGFVKAGMFFKKIKTIYVLSKKAMQVMKTKYQLDNVHYIPHIVNCDSMGPVIPGGKDFIYFGFIGRNKGIEYCLKLHQYILDKNPGIRFYVIGKALGKERSFYEELKKKYSRNVEYMGYVEEKYLNEIFDKAAFALLMFRKYKFYWPLSGSILYSLKKGKIVLTNEVNTIPEIIIDKKTGFFLSGNLKEDAQLLSSMLDNNSLLEKINKESRNYILENHSAAIINEKFKD